MDRATTSSSGVICYKSGVLVLVGYIIIVEGKASLIILLKSIELGVFDIVVDRPFKFIESL